MRELTSNSFQRPDSPNSPELLTFSFSLFGITSDLHLVIDRLGVKNKYDFVMLELFFGSLLFYCDEVEHMQNKFQSKIFLL